MKYVPASGPAKADLLIVGEAPGETEDLEGRPFVGSSGIELTRMLSEAGIQRHYAHVTNVCHYRPPGNAIEAWFCTKTQVASRGYHEVMGRFAHENIVRGIQELEETIQRVEPKVILALGDTALWALTGERGIKKWRGSYLAYRGDPSILVIPTYHPAMILRSWEDRGDTIQDFRRVQSALHSPPVAPEYTFTVRPSFVDVHLTLNSILALAAEGPTKISIDIETTRGHIACVGLGTSAESAICIPLIANTKTGAYWTPEEELSIIDKLHSIFTHPNVLSVLQNGLYDLQYFARYWGFIPARVEDTMLMQHVMFPGRPKGLDYLSSMYCKYHVYWKDEGKNIDHRVQEDQWWIYNCKDCVTTFEVHDRMTRALDILKLRGPFDNQMVRFRNVLRLMLRGVRFDQKLRTKQAMQVAEQAAMIETDLTYLGEGVFPKARTKTPWYSSPTQLAKILYEYLKIKPALNRKTRRPSTDDAACETVMKREPLTAPILSRILELRSLSVFSNNFLSAECGKDSRMRCSYNVGGTGTFRLSSSKDAFGSGLNLQNIPRNRGK